MLSVHKLQVADKLDSVQYNLPENRQLELELSDLLGCSLLPQVVVHNLHSYKLKVEKLQ